MWYLDWGTYNDLPKGECNLFYYLICMKYGVQSMQGYCVFGLVSIYLCHNNSEVGGLRPSPARIAGE